MAQASISAIGLACLPFRSREISWVGEGKLLKIVLFTRKDKAMPKIIPDIPAVFKDSFPQNFQNTFPNFGFFARAEIAENYGRLMMLDIDFGRYCSLECPGCFRKSSVVDNTPTGDLTYAELLNVIDEARKLGLRNVKICGAGESTQNTRFLQFIRDMTARDIGVAVFTKGQVLGNDGETRKFNEKRYKITSAMELCRELLDLKVSILLNFVSFQTEIQDEAVGNVSGHTLVRNQALSNLVAAGFNKTHPTRLSICANPITRQIFPELFDIYVYARERNIYPLITALMISGKQIDQQFLDNHDVADDEKIDLWTRIYRWNIDHGIQTLEQIKKDGISVMPGIHPCNQIACGLYITAKGNVVGCPGFTSIEGNVRNESLKDIWERSENRRQRAGQFNCLCPPKDDITIPLRLYSRVLKNLVKPR